MQLSTILALGAALAAMDAAAQTNTQAGPPMPPPPLPSLWYQTVAHGVTVTNLSPMSYFRGLLGMTPAERARMLAGQSEEKRAQVLAKVREYEALPRDIREERMRQTDMHWYLLTMLPMDAAHRNERLKEISPLCQPMIMVQLAEWDKLPEGTRRALLAKQSFLRTYVQWQGQSPAAQEDLLRKLPDRQRAGWAQELNRWQGLSESRRDELSQAFRQFFYQSGEERKETIQALSAAERRQMEEALQSYANLAPALQRQCVDSFSKFAQMSAQERSQFLQNAAKWESMTPHEREVWRMLVDRLPPMPPPPPPPPLLPPALPPPVVANK